ncbi:MAG: hypothetical protein ACUVXI_09710 [bacterium]
MLLGEILIQEGKITREQLEKGLAYQREHGGFLGNALVHLKFVDMRTVLEALEKQHGYRKGEKGEWEIEDESK